MINSLLRRLRSRPRAVDMAFVLALFALSFPGSLVALPGREPAAPWWPAVLLAGVSCSVLPWRRSRPRTTAAVTTVCATGVAALGHLLTVLMLAPLMVALHSLAGHTGRKVANTFTVVAIVLLVGTGLVAGPAEEPLVLRLLGPAAWLLLPTSLGTVNRLRTAYLEAVRARAEHAERTREEEALRRVTEERMRIARDLHDVVAHHLVLANIQVGAVTRFIRTRPDEAERMAAELKGTTTSALRELRATVGLLRHADHAQLPLEPTPGLAQLPDLAASFESAGLVVAVSVEGEPRPLSAGVDLTAYRIVQEALTNVTKHATTGSAEVRLAYSPDRLGITVANEGGSVTAPSATAPSGPTPAPDSGGTGGYGVMGMRERAHSVGGRLHVGHRPQGGFEVVTELPLPPRRQPQTTEESVGPP